MQSREHFIIPYQNEEYKNTFLCVLLKGISSIEETNERTFLHFHHTFYSIDGITFKLI